MDTLAHQKFPEGLRHRVARRDDYHAVLSSDPASPETGACCVPCASGLLPFQEDGSRLSEVVSVRD